MPVSGWDAILAWSLGHWMRASRRLGHGREPATAMTVGVVGDYGLWRSRGRIFVLQLLHMPWGPRSGSRAYAGEAKDLWNSGQRERGLTLDLTSIV
jgi:hypothetical protein